MNVLQGIYGGRKDAVYRGKLKDRINREFQDKLLYFQWSHSVPEIVSKEALNEHVDTMIDKEMYIMEAARYLKEDIIYYAKTLRVSINSWWTS